MRFYFLNVYIFDFFECSLISSAFRAHIFLDILVITDLGHKIEVSKCFCSDLVNYITQLHRYVRINRVKFVEYGDQFSHARAAIRQSPARYISDP